MGAGQEIGEQGRWYDQENARFCRISRGPAEELIDDFNICLDEGYGDVKSIESLVIEACSLVARTNGYIACLSRSKPGE